MNGERRRLVATFIERPDIPVESWRSAEFIKWAKTSKVATERKNGVLPICLRRLCRTIKISAQKVTCRKQSM